ncbi:hypothetical protein DH2020_000757 [Rehmannia glutinosa]|uniref:Uncharacterized protein n=1 Tax=Rehmannia glutinosa TaxID=99300 RepID=A0ABR0XXJ4_REHGL
MAYRRRQQVGRADTPFTYNYDSAPPPPADSSASSSSASSLATKAIRASSAYRDSSLSSVYEQSALSSPRGSTPSSAKGVYVDCVGLVNTVVEISGKGMEEVGCLPCHMLILDKPNGEENERFLWDDADGDNHTHLVAWEEVIRPKEVGGLGIADVFLGNFGGIINTKGRVLWSAIAHVMCWSLWIERNRRIFEDIAEPLEEDSSIYEPTSKNMNESKQGFWGVLARKAKAILDDDDDNMIQPRETPGGTKVQSSDRSKKGQYHSTYDSPESRRKTDGHTLQKGLDAIASSLNSIGGTIGNALEEGITAVENRTADIIQETRKIQIRKKNSIPRSQDQFSNLGSLRQQPMPQTHVQPQTHTTLETQLKASRDVAMAMAAKAKLLLRELKTVKADLAFAKERCAQLEEENRFLRESREKIRLQLESLLAEKARLAQENSVYARENRFLREIVEYHQLTMQDVVYLDEGSEEVTEVYPIKINVQSSGTMSAVSPTPTVPQGAIPQVTQNVSPSSVPSLDLKVASQTVHAVNPYVQMPAEDLRRH